MYEGSSTFDESHVKKNLNSALVEWQNVELMMTIFFFNHSERKMLFGQPIYLVFKVLEIWN